MTLLIMSMKKIGRNIYYCIRHCICYNVYMTGCEISPYHITLKAYQSWYKILEHKLFFDIYSYYNRKV